MQEAPEDPSKPVTEGTNKSTVNPDEEVCFWSLRASNRVMKSFVLFFMSLTNYVLNSLEETFKSTAQVCFIFGTMI